MSLSKLKSISRSSGSGQGAQAQIHYTPLQPSHIGQVKDKIKQHPEFKNCSGPELEELALRLTKPQELIKYFSLTIDWEKVESAAEATNAPLLETHKLTGASKNGGQATEELPVMLILSRTGNQGAGLPVTRMLEMEYGPLYASLQVGDQILEWNSTSLIIPHGRPIQDPSKGFTDTGSSGHFFEVTNDRERVELVFKAPGQRAQRLNKVVQVIVKYNCYKYYDVLSCNSHRFVCDAATAMGYEQPPQLHSNLSKYFEKLKAGKNKMIPNDFETHEQLDTYVRERMGEFSPQDKEYLLCKYFQFHIGGKIEAKDPASWRCGAEGCQSEELERQLDNGSLVLNHFIHTTH